MSLCVRDVIDYKEYPIDDKIFTQECAEALARDGILTLQGFVTPQVITKLVAEAEAHKHEAYYTSSTHNVYLTPMNPDLEESHVFNRQVCSSKGCITTDQVPENSELKLLYKSPLFRTFVARVVNKNNVYEYADPLSSINVNFASNGQELGWHFDNSEFATTLLLQAPEAGGDFEYVRDLRDAEAGELNFEGVAAVLDGKLKPNMLKIAAGTLVLFRGRNSLHRVAPAVGTLTRILVVFAYNTVPGIALSESARMTFFGRLG